MSQIHQILSLMEIGNAATVLITELPKLDPGQLPAPSKHGLEQTLQCLETAIYNCRQRGAGTNHTQETNQ